ncbi:MAG TPA: hypothetical protein VHR66_21290 [Gemmataceae bacterium]|nr:hypothetical protein [Gemmataceae bacterium]
MGNVDRTKESDGDGGMNWCARNYVLYNRKEQILQTGAFMDPTGPNDIPEEFRQEPISPDLLAFARQTLNMEEIMEGIRDIKANGGRTFEELIAEVETLVRGS